MNRMCSTPGDRTKIIQRCQISKSFRCMRWNLFLLAFTLGNMGTTSIRLVDQRTFVRCSTSFIDAVMSENQIFSNGLVTKQIITRLQFSMKRPIFFISFYRQILIMQYPDPSQVTKKFYFQFSEYPPTQLFLTYDSRKSLCHCCMITITLRIPLVLFHRKSNQSPHFPSCPLSAISVRRQFIVIWRTPDGRNSCGIGSSFYERKFFNYLSIQNVFTQLALTP